jgi:HAD superfamily hydrolase (TIGR01490 family)
MGKRRIVAFDFDGTLTTRDTLFAFVRFACGSWALVRGMVRMFLMLSAAFLHFYPNGKAKERFFSLFFKGMSYQKFCQLGRDFADSVERFQRDSVLEELLRYCDAGCKVYVITASIDEWVRPWCERYGIRYVLATRVEVADGFLTGSFSTPNCYGCEKVLRLLEMEPERTNYHLTVYGDSRGDRELLTFADVAVEISTWKTSFSQTT